MDEDNTFGPQALAAVQSPSPSATATIVPVSDFPPAPIPEIPISSSLASSAGDMTDEYLLLGLDLYWLKWHPFRPLVHRGALEAVFTPFSNAPSCYTVPPRALAYAMAACGLSMYQGPTNYSSAQQYRRASLSFARAASVALLAGYLDREHDANVMEDLEAVQTICLVWCFYSPYTFGPLFKTLHLCMVALVRRICVDPFDDRTVPALAPPQTAAEWLAAEAKIRVFIFGLVQDSAFAVHFGWPASPGWTRHLVVLPANDLLHDTMSAEKAFQTIQTSFLGGSPSEMVTARFPGLRMLNNQPAVDLTELELEISAEHVVDAAEQGNIARDFVCAGFSWTFATWALAIIPSVLRLRLIQLDTDAATSRVDPVVFLEKSGELDTVVERFYRLQFEKLRNAAFRAIGAIPNGVGSAMLAGDAAPLFNSGLAGGIASYPHASALIQFFILHLLYLVIRSLAGKNPTAGHYSLFASPLLFTAFKAATMVVSIARGMLQHDPEMEFVQTASIMPVFAAGYVLIGAARAYREPQTVQLVASQLDVLAQMMEKLTSRYGGPGVKMSSAFRADVDSIETGGAWERGTIENGDHGSAAVAFVRTISNAPRDLFKLLEVQDEDNEEEGGAPLFRIASMDFNEV